MSQNFKVGDLLINTVGQFTRIISVQANRFGLSGWTTRVNAEKANVATKFVNIYGLEAAQVRVVGKGTSKKTEDSASEEKGSDDNKPTKTSLNKLNAKAVSELTESLGIEVASTRAENLEKLYTHFEL
jgi:hypothetical protein